MTLVICQSCSKLVSETVKACPSCGAQPDKSSWQKALLIVVGIIVFLGMIGGKDKASPTADSTAPVSLAETAQRNMTLSFEWTTGGFGSIMMADFTVRNDNGFAVKDIHVKCTSKGKSGTVVDTNSETIYDVVPAKSTRSFKEVNMGFIDKQANSSVCEIEKVAIR